MANELVNGPSLLSGSGSPNLPTPDAPQPLGGSVLSGVPDAVVNAPQPDQQPTTPSPVIGNLNPPPAGPATFAQKLGVAADKLGIPTNKPGGWARSLVGAAQSVLSGLQDASSTPVIPGGSGVLEGITQTLANRNNRLQTEKAEAQKQTQQQFENARQTQQDQRAEQAASIAMENAHMAHDQYLNANIKDGLENTVKSGSMSIKPFLAAHAPVIQEDVDSTTAENLIRQNKLDPTQVHAFPTGQTPAGPPDKNGVTPMRATYTVVGDVPSVTINEKDNPGLAAYLSKWTNQNIQDGQKFDGFRYGALIQQANSAETTQNAIDAAREKAGLDAADTEQQKRILGMNPDLNIAMAKAKGDPVGAVKFLASDPQMVKKYPNGAKDAIEAIYHTKEDPSGVKEYETAVHESRQDAIKQQKENLDQQKENLKKTTDLEFGDSKLIHDPQAFAASMDPKAKALVDDLGRGQISLPNLAYVVGRKPEIIEAVAALYPDFDSSKAATYPQVYKAFSPGGKVAEQMNSGAVALRHLNELSELNTYKSHLPFGPDRTAYDNKMDTVAGEISEFYKTNNIPGVERVIKDLNSTYPGSREAAIQTQAGSMLDKFGEYNQQWKNAAPSKYYEAPIPGISKEAQAAVDHFNNIHKPEAPPTPAAALVPPTGTTHIAKDKNSDQWYYTNQQGQPLGPAPAPK